MIPSSHPIYLDYHATTPVDLRVAERIYQAMISEFGNASSIDREYGDRAESTVKQAAKHLANLVGASPREIIWTSGATESINLAIQGSLSPQPENPYRIALLPLEHKAVLDTCKAFERRGWAELIHLKVDAKGRIEPLIFGGGHQRGMRSGTLNVPGIAGLGEACRLRLLEMEVDEKAIAKLRDRLQTLLLEQIPDLIINGDLTANFSYEFIVVKSEVRNVG